MGGERGKWREGGRGGSGVGGRGSGEREEGVGGEGVGRGSGKRGEREMGEGGEGLGGEGLGEREWGVRERWGGGGVIANLEHKRVPPPLQTSPASAAKQVSPVLRKLCWHRQLWEWVCEGGCERGEGVYEGVYVRGGERGCMGRVCCMLPKYPAMSSSITFPVTPAIT